MQRLFESIALLLALLVPTGTLSAGEGLQTAQQQLVVKTGEYRDELVKLLEVREDARRSLEEGFEKRRELFASGLISRQDLEKSESALSGAVSGIRELNAQIAEAEQLIAEVKLALETPRSDEPQSPVIRFEGSGKWSLNEVQNLQNFFTHRFGELLPVSAVGQTELHSRFGLLHTTAVDVALHPDSEEGLALLEHLREAGIPFIAFRSAVPGSATGAHIHIGPPSVRIHTAL